ncbi:MAG: trigger factor [Prevotella sp.]|nr:trigger factor [Prevotella sp.]
MNISFENPDKINGVLKITIEKDDYQGEVDKTLKNYRKQANIPGFRQGQAPIGMIKRQFGMQVKMDVINKILGEKLNGYIIDNKIAMLGTPLPNEAQVEQDLEKDGPFEFIFDIAVAPEINIEINGNDEIDHYSIEVDDKLVDQQVDMFRSRAGHYDKVEEYDAAQNDMLKGDLRELDADGNAKEDGIVVEQAVLMPEYIKVEDQKSLFDGAKLGSVITFNPKKAYPESNAEIKSLLKISDEQAEGLTSDFTFLVTEISRFVKAEVNQELFDQVFGEGNVNDEADFRQKVAESIKTQFSNDEEFKFMLDIRKYAEDKVGEVAFPDELLKRVMKSNNQDKDDKFIEDNYAASIKELKWSLIKNELMEANELKVEKEDVVKVVKDIARMQFAQYGMSNVPEEYLDNYVDKIMKEEKNLESYIERASDIKLAAALKKVVKLNEKTVSLDEFNKIMSEK